MILFNTPIFSIKMPTIILTTEINANIDVCFDLARSIDLHKISTTSTNEQAIDGKTSGLIGYNETVTWEATHLGFRQKLTSKITAFQFPYYFRDVQIKGIFKSIYHEHTFECIDNKTIMKDIFRFKSPFGLLGQIFNQLYLTNYLRGFLIKRNEIIKEFAESEKWKEVLNKK